MKVRNRGFEKVSIDEFTSIIRVLYMKKLLCLNVKQLTQLDMIFI